MSSNCRFEELGTRTWPNVSSFLLPVQLSFNTKISSILASMGRLCMTTTSHDPFSNVLEHCRDAELSSSEWMQRRRVSWIEVCSQAPGSAQTHFKIPWTPQSKWSSENVSFAFWSDLISLSKFLHDSKSTHSVAATLFDDCLAFGNSPSSSESMTGKAFHKILLSGSHHVRATPTPLLEWRTIRFRNSLPIEEPTSSNVHVWFTALCAVRNIGECSISIKFRESASPVKYMMSLT